MSSNASVLTPSNNKFANFASMVNLHGFAQATTTIAAPVAPITAPVSQSSLGDLASRVPWPTATSAPASTPAVAQIAAPITSFPQSSGGSLMSRVSWQPITPPETPQERLRKWLQPNSAVLAFPQPFSYPPFTPPLPPPPQYVSPPPIPLSFAPSLPDNVHGTRIRLTIDLFVPDNEAGRAQLRDLEWRYQTGCQTWLTLHDPMDICAN